MGKTRADFEVNPHKRCLHRYFFRNMADEQVGMKCTLCPTVNSICTIYCHITVSTANETQTTHKNYRLGLVSILLQRNRVVYKHSHQQWILFYQSFCIMFCTFINIFIRNVHCFCPCYNSFVVMDWEIAMIHISLCSQLMETEIGGQCCLHQIRNILILVLIGTDRILFN